MSARQYDPMFSNRDGDGQYSEALCLEFVRLRERNETRTTTEVGP